MPTVEELRGACPDWATVDEIQARLGLPQANLYHQRVRQDINFWRPRGAFEVRKEPGAPTQYRAAPGWEGRAYRPVQRGLLAVLGDGMTTREAADAAGTDTRTAYKSLARLEARGIIRGERTPGAVRWHKTRSGEDSDGNEI